MSLQIGRNRKLQSGVTYHRKSLESQVDITNQTFT